jgi:hypothetical protein
MNTTSPNLETSRRTPNAEALLKCQAALELRDRSDFQGARAVMDPLWKRVGERPELKGLHTEVAAEVLLTVGILTSWIGSKDGIEDAQEIAKNLISESIGFYSVMGDLTKAAPHRQRLLIAIFVRVL